MQTQTAQPGSTSAGEERQPRPYAIPDRAFPAGSDGARNAGATLGPVQRSTIVHFNRYKPTTVIEQAQEWFGTVADRDRAHQELAEAEESYFDEEPTIPPACMELDRDTGDVRAMRRDEMWSNAETDFGGSGTLWLERVLAFDQWELDCREAQARWRLPQRRARAARTIETADDMLSRVFTVPAKTPREAAVKLGLFIADGAIGLLDDENSAPLRQLFAELVAMSSPPVPIASASGPQASA